MTDAPERPRLGSRGQIHVTLSAARRYAEYAGIGEEAARRELLGLLADAVCTREAERPGDAESWRYRRGSAGVDITARVVWEGSIASVVSVSARDHNVGARGGKRREPR